MYKLDCGTLWLGLQACECNPNLMTLIWPRFWHDARANLHDILQPRPVESTNSFRLGSEFKDLGLRLRTKGLGRGLRGYPPSEGSDIGVHVHCLYKGKRATWGLCGSPENPCS